MKLERQRVRASIVERRVSRLTRVLVVLAPPLIVPLAIVAACKGPSVPAPELRDHPPGPGEATCVPYPPPAAKVEEVPTRPNDRAVWVDGQWTWETRRWVWKSGGWAVPPPGGWYARWKVDRLENGALAFVPGHWHNELSHGNEPYDANAVLVCPKPEEPTAGKVVVDGELEAEAHVGPILVYSADAEFGAPGKVVPDAVIPGDAAVVVDAKRDVIQPPD